ncbi:MAG TPA: DUF4129 domain-containing protein [Candidatus Dormibacteraeota bacterium]|nr:DUF4129 domain-containing protein [Candidatus Dormibacteraeota bacterium]
MQRRARETRLILGLGLLLGLVALASRPSSLGSTGGLAAPAWIGVASDTIVQALLILLLMAALTATAINLWVAFPLPRGRPRARPLSASIAGYLYFGAAICALILLRQRLLRAQIMPPPSTGAGVGLGGVSALPSSHAITGLSFLIALAGIAAAAGLLLRWLRSGATGGRAAASTEEPKSRVVAAVEESLAQLQAEKDPRRAVIAAYARLEAELKAAGRPRQPSEAPLEYLARILSTFSVGPASLRRLTDLFEWAKFSQHTVDASMKEEAIDALQRVRAELSNAPVRVAG